MHRLPKVAAALYVQPEIRAVENTRARMSAVAAVTLRRSLHSSLTCLRCTPMASASAPCVRPSGFMNSSTRISPGVAGLRFVISMVASPIAMVVEIEVFRFAPAAVPPKHQPPSLIDANRVKAVEMAPQLLEMVTGRRSQIPVRRRVVDHLKFAEQAIFQVGRGFLRSHVVDEELAQPVIPEADNHDAGSI